MSYEKSNKKTLNNPNNNNINPSNHENRGLTEKEKLLLKSLKTSQENIQMSKNEVWVPLKLKGKILSNMFLKKNKNNDNNNNGISRYNHSNYNLKDYNNMNHHDISDDNSENKSNSSLSYNDDDDDNNNNNDIHHNMNIYEEENIQKNQRVYKPKKKSIKRLKLKFRNAFNNEDNLDNQQENQDKNQDNGSSPDFVIMKSEDMIDDGRDFVPNENVENNQQIVNMVTEGNNMTVMEKAKQRGDNNNGNKKRKGYFKKEDKTKDKEVDVQNEVNEEDKQKIEPKLKKQKKVQNKDKDEEDDDDDIEQHSRINDLMLMIDVTDDDNNKKSTEEGMTMYSENQKNNRIPLGTAYPANSRPCQKNKRGGVANKKRKGKTVKKVEKRKNYDKENKIVAKAELNESLRDKNGLDLSKNALSLEVDNDESFSIEIVIETGPDFNQDMEIEKSPQIILEEVNDFNQESIINGQDDISKLEKASKKTKSQKSSRRKSELGNMNTCHIDDIPNVELNKSLEMVEPSKNAQELEINLIEEIKTPSLYSPKIYGPFNQMESVDFKKPFSLGSFFDKSVKEALGIDFTLKSKDKIEITVNCNTSKRIIKSTHVLTEEEIKLQNLMAFIKDLATQYNKKEEDLLDLLDNTSGDYDDLKAYLSTQDRAILWTESEDEDLLENNPKVLKYLTNVKGQARIERRKKFLNEKSAQRQYI